jgi:hypothetical protein
MVIFLGIGFSSFNSLVVQYVPPARTFRHRVACDAGSYKGIVGTAVQDKEIVGARITGDAMLGYAAASGLASPAMRAPVNALGTYADVPPARTFRHRVACDAGSNSLRIASQYSCRSLHCRRPNPPDQYRISGHGNRGLIFSAVLIATMNGLPFICRQLPCALPA